MLRFGISLFDPALLVLFGKARSKLLAEVSRCKRIAKLLEKTPAGPINHKDYIPSSIGADHTLMYKNVHKRSI